MTIEQEGNTAKQTITTTAPIVGWDCVEDGTIEGQPRFICTPSDDYIRHRAFFRSVTQNPPGATPFAYWITAEADFLAAGGNDLPPLL